MYPGCFSYYWVCKWINHTVCDGCGSIWLTVTFPATEQCSLVGNDLLSDSALDRELAWVVSGMSHIGLLKRYIQSRLYTDSICSFSKRCLDRFSRFCIGLTRVHCKNSSDEMVYEIRRPRVRVCTVLAHNRAPTDAAEAKKYGRASIGVSVAGTVITVVMIIVIFTLNSAAAADDQWRPPTSMLSHQHLCQKLPKSVDVRVEVIMCYNSVVFWDTVYLLFYC